MATPSSTMRFLGVDSALMDLTEKKSSRGNTKTEYFTADEIGGANNFASENLTFDANRAHDTAGFSLTISTDTGVLAEGWSSMASTKNEFGFANTWHKYLAAELHTYVNNDEIMSVKDDGMYNHNTTAGAPGAADIDTFVMYSDDISPGNAAPHFLTENSETIKLYTEPAVTTTQGMATALAAQGLLATSTLLTSATNTSEVRVAEYTVTKANLLAMNGTPVTALAAPGAGFALEFISAVLIYDYATATYTGGGDVTIEYTGGAVVSTTIASTDAFAAAGDKVFDMKAVQAAGGFTMPVNTGLDITNATGAFVDPGTAAGVGRLHISYRVHTTGL